MSILLLLILCLGLAACGSEETEKAEKTPRPTVPPGIDLTSAPEQTWDLFTIYIPDDMEFFGGSDEDPDDTNCFMLKKDYEHYIKFASNEQKQPILDLYNSHIEQITYTKTPIEGHYGEFRIKGVQFEDEEGTVGFEAYAKQKRGYTLISSMGYPFDSPVAVGVICAVKIDGIMDNITPRPDSE